MSQEPGPSRNFSPARILSVNVGMPQPVQVRDRAVLTSIFKSAVLGRRRVVRHNIEGDRQSDLTVHGGQYKAVYCYPSENYPFWKEQLPGADLPYGMFGENLTTEGLLEDEAYIGDQFRFGSAILQVTQPRMPCFKLGIRFNRSDIVKRFWQAGRPGIYFSIVEEGDLAPGDPVQLVLSAASTSVSVADVVRLYRGENTNPELVARALSAPLYGGWKQGVREHQDAPPLPF